MDFISTEEKLIGAEIAITNALRMQEPLRTIENINCPVRTEEALSRDLKTPLKIKGRMLGEGRHKVRYYQREELKTAVNKVNNQKFPLKLDHRKDEVSATIGAVDRIYWDDEENAIMYEAHINDDVMSRNVLDNVVREVSVNIDALNKFDEAHGLIGVDLDFTELSFVEKGAYANNTVKVVD